MNQMHETCSNEAEAGVRSSMRQGQKPNGHCRLLDDSR